MATEQDHVWAMLDDMLVFLSKRHVPTPERTYKLDGGWTLAMDDLRRFVDALTTERDQLRAENERLRGLLCAECGGTGEIDSGICFCGDDYNSHTVGHGHAPVDCPQQCGTCAKKERMIELRGAYQELQRIVGEDCGIVFGGDLPHVCRETLEDRILELQQEEGTIWA